MLVSLIIPAYNESERIGASLTSANAWVAAQRFPCEVLVVDDGSTDSTAAMVSEAGGDHVRLVAQPRNMGKGAAVRRGMLEARGDYRIFSDADFSTPITEADRVLDHLQRHDVVIGSRALDASYIKEHQPWYREHMGKVFNLLVQLVAVPGIHDTQCGFKGFTARAAEEVFSRTRIEGFGFDVEALYVARRLGFRIEEIPVVWYNDPRSKLDPIKDSLRMFTELLRVRRLHRDLVQHPARVSEPRESSAPLL
jgi:dolichyl-phosphate beta-glucosyltransferase